MMEPCPICNEQITPIGYMPPHSVNGFKITCSRCGKYRITEDSLDELRKVGSQLRIRQRANMSGFLRENQTYVINKLGNLLGIKTPSFHERADKLLLALERETEYAGQSVSLENIGLSHAWCLNGDELFEILSFLDDVDRIKAKEGEVKIVAGGWKHLEQLKRANSNSQQGFVAMWFDDRMMKIYDDVISKGILNAEYKPHLVIDREHNGKIDDEIIAQIRRSRFLLADFTGHRGGVYYEAGYAQGLGIEVIWSCNKDDIDKLHFDIRQYNCISWTDDNLEEFKRRITSRIEASIGRGDYRQQEKLGD